MFKERKVQPGDSFTYRNFELSLMRPVVVRVWAQSVADLHGTARLGDPRS